AKNQSKLLNYKNSVIPFSFASPNSGEIVKKMLKIRRRPFSSKNAWEIAIMADSPNFLIALRLDNCDGKAFWERKVLSLDEIILEEQDETGKKKTFHDKYVKPV